MSADNQQERLLKIGWIVGFVDGEGCFSVSVFRNHISKLDWQAFPEFAVTQGKKSLKCLELMKNYFDCGKITVNKRNDNHKENLYRFVVRRIDDLAKIIIPFFKNYPLKTAKNEDFKIFAQIVSLMLAKEHFTFEGLTKIARMASTMNRRSQSKFLTESSETTR